MTTIIENDSLVISDYPNRLDWHEALLLAYADRGLVYKKRTYSYMRDSLLIAGPQEVVKEFQERSDAYYAEIKARDDAYDAEVVVKHFSYGRMREHKRAEQAMDALGVQYEVTRVSLFKAHYKVTGPRYLVAKIMRSY